MKTVTLYGIRNKKSKNPIGFNTFSTYENRHYKHLGAKFCINNFDTRCLMFMVSDKEMAIRALKSRCDWCNSHPERPQWPFHFNPLKWEVFSINFTVITEKIDN